MKCAACQRENESGAQFCSDCGNLLCRVCRNCQLRVPLTARFCAGCGVSMQTLPNEAASAGGPRGVFVSRSAITGERKLITIMFADIVNSTQLIEDLDPDEAASQLQAVIETMREAVRRFDGTVNKIQGDGIMALFGAPIPQEDHAVRACCAALAMREAVTRLQASHPKLRIGVHTGETLVQSIRNDLSEQYDAAGIAVHVAARMQQAAEPSAILLSAATVGAARFAIDVEARGRHDFKGLSQSVEVFSLRSIRRAAASAQFRGGQRLSTFVGRDSELQRLIAVRDGDATNGSPRVVEIAGEPGVGKSRLLFEFLEASRDRGFAPMEACATAHGQVTPFQPVLELMRSYFGIGATDSISLVIDKIAGSLDPLGLSRHSEALLQFLGAHQQPYAHGDVSQRRQQLLEAIREIAHAASLRIPAIVALEDVHWLDEASKPLLAAFIRGIAGTRTLMVTTHRLGFDSFLPPEGKERIVLKPLSTDALGTILDGTLEDGDLRRRLVERAGGNPFFAEELVRAVAVNQPSRHGASAVSEALALPDTVRGVVAYRIDRLPEGHKYFMQAASVLGRDFSRDVAASVAEISTEAAREVAASLVNAEMLYERDNGSSGDLAFKHPLVHEVGYASLVAEQRRAMHRRAAAALSEHFLSKREENAALVAHHWSEGGDAMKAAACYQTSAQWLGVRDPAQALRSWERVRTLLRTVPVAPMTQYMTMMACGQSINLAWRQGIAIDEVEPIYREATAIAAQLRDARAAALITLAYGRLLLAAGSADEYITRVEQAQVLLAAAPNPSVEALLIAVLSHAVGTSGRLELALRHNAMALELESKIEAADRQLLGFEPRHWLWALRARYLALTGRTNEAEGYINRLLGDPAEPIDVLHRAQATGVQLDLAVFAHDTATVDSVVDKLDGMLSGERTPYLTVLKGHYRGIALVARQRWSEGRTLLTGTLAFARSNRAGLELEPFVLANLGEATAADDPAEAFRCIDEALALARRRSMRVAEAYALTSKLRVRARLGLEAGQNDRLEVERLIAETGATGLSARLGARS